MLLVTGATGTLGKLVVAELLRRVAPGEIAVSVRDPGKARELAALGVRVRRGDFADPDTLASAFEGARRVLVVSSNAAATGGDPLAHHRAAFRAAGKAGAERIFYTSHAAAGATSLFAPARDHAATEAMLAAGDIPWTALRHGFYAASALMFMGDWRSNGIVAAPADGPVAWTTHADLAAANAALLTSADVPDGPTAPLTGSAALDLAGLAALAGELSGRTIARHVLPDSSVAARMAARGAPPAAAEIALGFFRAARAGAFAAVDPSLSRLIGREPGRVGDVLRRSLDG